MKKITEYSVVLIIFSLGLAFTQAEDKHDHMKPYEGSKDFRRIKQLEGRWEGTAKENGNEKISVDYKVTSGGSAVLETIGAGTPHEMVSVYHEQGGKLKMTHYCMLANQPQMALKKSGPDELVFEFVKGNAINAAKDSHMHAVNISFTDPDNITEKWSLFEDGRELNSTVFKLTRVR